MKKSIILLLLLLYCSSSYSQYNTGIGDGYSDIGMSINYPSLISPTNNSNQQVSPNMQWQAVSGATSYTLQISLVNDFSTTVINQSGITDNNYQASGLNYNTLYYWRVNATNGSITSLWSSIRSFTTSFLVAPVLVLPTNNSSNQPTNPTLVWNLVNNALNYNLQISTTTGFSVPILDTIISDTSVTIPSGLLINNTTYYWRLRAVSGQYLSVWSNTWNFKLITNSTNFSKLSFQGVIKNSSNQMIPNGTYDIHFKIYSYETGGTVLWQETQSCSIYNGLLSVILGTQNPIQLPFNTSYWLGVSLNNDVELSPRMPMVGPIYNTGFGR